MRVTLPDFADARGKRVLVALSGGADSVALLSMLAEFGECTLFAAHLNHCIRGAEADADEEYCRALCRRLNVPFTAERMPVPSLAKSRGEGLETAARSVRYEFLYETADKVRADFIALAHHADDLAETVLMHLLRGTGPEGITGMKTVSGRLYRPLLNVHKSELTAYLSERNIPWREDATNAVPDNPRNRLRLQVLPLLETIYPGAADAVTRYARLAAVESGYIARQAERVPVRRYAFGFCIDLTSPVPEAILRRVLRPLLGSGADAAAVDRVIGLSARERGRESVKGSVTAEKTNGRLYILDGTVSPQPAEPFRTGETRSFNGRTIESRECAPEILKGDHTVEILNADALEGAVLRTWEKGDRFHPLGSKGSRLLSDFFIDKKLDRPLRGFLPVLAKRDEILWVCGMGISQSAAITPETRRAVRVSVSENVYKTEEPK